MKHLRNPFLPVFKVGFHSFFLAVILLSIASVSSDAQVGQIPPSEMPQGESVLKNFDVTYDASFPGSKGQVYHRYRKTSCFVTSNGIYSEEGVTFSYAQKIWMPPSEIKGVWQKKSSTDSDDYTTILVFTGDGNMHQLTFVRSARVNGPVSLSSDKILPSSTGVNGVTIAAGDDLYIVSQNVVYVLHDSVHWQVDTAGLNGAYLSAMALDSSQNVYVSSFSGMFEQGLKDSVWHPLSGAPNAQFLWVSEEDVMYAGTGTYLYVSTNRGVTWTLDTAGIANAGQVKAMDEDTSGNLYAITSSYQAGVGDNVWMKPVGGSWQSIDYGLNAISADPTIAFMTGVTSDSLGVHVATKFGEFFLLYGSTTWQEISRDVDAANIYGYYRFSSGRQLATTSLGLYTKDADDTAWTKRFPIGAYLSSVKFFVDNANRMYAIGVSQTVNYNTRAKDIFISADQGSTWTADTTGLSYFSGGMEFVDEMGTEHLAGLLQNMQTIQIFSKQHGGQWQGDSAGYSSMTGDVALAFATDHRGSIYFTVTNSQNGNRMLRRSITGGSWSEISTSTLGGVPYAMTSTKDGKLIGGNTGTSVGYFDGSSWNVMPNPPGLSNPSGYPESVDSSDRVWVLYGSFDQNYNYTPYGTYWTSDLGQNWTKAADGSFNFASLVSFGDTTYGLGSGDGLSYFVPGSAGVSEPSSGTVKVTIAPNPSTGNIRIIMNGAQNLNVEIYDVLGNRVAAVKSLSGMVNWNGEDQDGSKVSSGTYIARITGNDSDGNEFSVSKELLIQ